MTRMYEFDLFNHYGMEFYRIVVEAGSEKEALEKAKKEASEVTKGWVDLNSPINHPFYLYKRVGFVA